MAECTRGEDGEGEGTSRGLDDLGTRLPVPMPRERRDEVCGRFVGGHVRIEEHNYGGNTPSSQVSSPSTGVETNSASSTITRAYIYLGHRSTLPRGPIPRRRMDGDVHEAISKASQTTITVLPPSYEPGPVCRHPPHSPCPVEESDSGHWTMQRSLASTTPSDEKEIPC